MLSKSSFTDAKDIFSDIYDDDYVNLDSSVIAYEKMIEILEKPIKLALLYGEPGTGKTFLLKKIYRDLSKKKSIIFIPTPFFEESEFVRFIYQYTFKKEHSKVKNFDEYFKILSQNLQDTLFPITVFIDEAQMYPPQIVEKIRLLADTRKYKFIFTVHKTDEQEDVFAKDYFKTRIWESIELKNISYKEFKLYIEKKFLYHNKFDFIGRLSEKQYKIIYNYSKGNLRETNKILFRLFEICEYYDINEPNKINSRLINQKLVEMCAISLGYIDA